MSLKRIADNESGFTYTLEAIIGIFFILGTVIFITGNLPYTAQKNGEHSKVQLNNIGRDNLDLIVLAPASETNPDGLKGIVNRTYYLEADKTFVMPGENVTFRVYYLNGTPVTETLQLYQTISGYFVNTFMTNITGTTNYSWNASSNQNEYSIQASGPFGISNSVTIKVGYYFLDTDAFGVFIGANDTNVSGVVYNSSGGVPNLTMQIFKEDLTPVNLSAGKTNYGKIIENFDNYSNWSSTGNLANDIINKTEGNASMSVNSTSRSFSISKPLIQAVDEFDILSFDFYSNTGNELITVKLFNGTYEIISLTDAKLVPKDWTKISTRITNDTVIDSIQISVSNTTNESYLFDNMTLGGGKFKFQWPMNLPTGVYFINATDGTQSSNKRYIEFSDHTNSGNLLCKNMYIYETRPGVLFLTDNDCDSSMRDDFGPINGNYYVNEEKCGNDDCTTTGTGQNVKQNNYSLVRSADRKTITFTASVAGDYYIYRHSQGASAGTNTVIIHVLPIIQGGYTFDQCVDKGALNKYMRRYMPAYVNFNLYLIEPDGKRFERCPKFEEGQLINGYPTDEAVAVNKLVHIDYIPTDINDILELRMVLWYK
jgi:hypothetical protein